MKVKGCLVLLLALVLCFACAEAAQSPIYENGYFRVVMPKGFEGRDYNEGYFYRGNQFVTVQSAINEDFSAYEPETIFALVLADLFDKTPEVHESPEGFSYAIGTLTQDGVSFNIAIMLFKDQIVYALTQESNLLEQIVNNTQIMNGMTEKKEERVTKSRNGYLLHRGPLFVPVTEEEWTILLPDMEDGAVSLSRINKTKREVESTVKGLNMEMLLVPMKGTDFQMWIRIKDQKYSSYSAAERTRVLEETAMGFGGGTYETETIKGVKYYVFAISSSMKTEKRYMTIAEGDMIYIVGESTDPLTAEEDGYLRELVESIIYLH